MIFAVDDGVSGVELWKSDGTAVGTVLVKDIDSGAAGSSPTNLTNVNGVVYFDAIDDSHGNELWKSDGTAAGTVLVKDIRSGTGSTSFGFLTKHRWHALLQANDGVQGNELWRSDGNAANTVMVKDIFTGNGSANPNNLTNVNGTLFFTINDGVTATSYGSPMVREPGLSWSRISWLGAVARFRGVSLTSMARFTSKPLITSLAPSCEVGRHSGRDRDG